MNAERTYTIARAVQDDLRVTGEIGILERLVNALTTQVDNPADDYFTPAMTSRYRALIEGAEHDGLEATATATARRAEKAGASIWRVQVEMVRVA